MYLYKQMNNTSTVLITGGTGLIGTALAQLLLSKGYKVIILSRSARQSDTNNLLYATWNVEKQTIDATAIQQADYIVHLAGAGVADQRWTEKRKKEIIDSRTQSSALLVKALKENTNNVKAIISASGIGWYGEDPSIPNPKPFVETDLPDTGFLGDTCKQWEASIDPVTDLGKRLVKLRTGLVFSNSGGAYPEFKKTTKFGVASILGSGKQVISWIHIHDMCRLFLYAIENELLSGAYNAATAAPVSNKVLTMAIAKKVKGKLFIPVHVPAFVLKIVLGEMSIEVLKSATVSAKKIKDAGFQFTYPTVEAAINELVSH
jgi:uncharacterized protein